MLFLSTRLPQLELPRFLRLPLLAGAGETGLLPLLLLELQGLLGLGADPCGLGHPPAGAAWGFWEGADALSLAGAG